MHVQTVQAQQLDPRYFIVPGDSVGEIVIGMTVDQVRGILGKETVSEPLSSRDAAAAGPDVRFYGFGHPAGLRAENSSSLLAWKPGDTASKAVALFDHIHSAEMF